MKVIIVGGGLVGSLCGCYFGFRGHEVHIYEYRNDPRGEQVEKGRSINLALSTRGIEALSRVGLQHVVLALGVPMRGRMVHPKKGNRRSILYDPVYKRCIYSVERKHLNEVLITEADKYENVFLHFKHKVISVDFEQGKIFFKRSDSKLQEDCADLIIGADGAFSIVRREMIKRPMFNFSQNYIEHGYIELTISPENGHKLEPNHLHIWPRGQILLTALPNQDKSWTVSLFMPLIKFDELLYNEHTIKTFFQSNFPDAFLCIEESELMKNITKPSHLLSVKCSSYNIGKKGVIIGDAAHAMVPFYGQGMNAGFEDCRILDELMHKTNLNLEQALNLFSKTRSKNAEAISNLAMYNYLEMRELVTRPSYILRRKMDNLFYWLFTNRWIPLYESITFTNIPYLECLDHRSWQNSILQNIFYFSGVAISSSFLYLSWNILLRK